MDLSSGDQGEHLTGCVMASLFGQLDSEGLEISDLLSGHGEYRVGGALLRTCMVAHLPRGGQ